MRTFIFIILAGLLTAVVARPFQREPSPAGDAPVTQTLSLPSTLVFETSTSATLPDGTLAGETGYGVYSLLVSQKRVKPTSIKRIRLVKRQEYHILPEPNDQAVQTTSMSVNETASTNATQTTSSTNSTKTADDPPSTTPVNLVPHWNTEKHAIAFAVIFIIVVVVAFVVLLVLYLKKVKRFFQRCRRDKKSLLPKYDGVTIDGDEVSSIAPLNKESKSDRDAYSFEIDRSLPRSPPPEYIVEEDPEMGSVTRVYRVSRAECNNNFSRRLSAFYEQEQENEEQENEEQENEEQENEEQENEEQENEEQENEEQENEEQENEEQENEEQENEEQENEEQENEEQENEEQENEEQENEEQENEEQENEEQENEEQENEEQENEEQENEEQENEEQENEEQKNVVGMSRPALPPAGKLRESVQKPVLIIPKPLNPLNRVRSFSATTELQQYIYEPVSRASQDDGELPPRNSTTSESRLTRYSDPGPFDKPNRMSFLPRIQRSSSPLFTFDDE
ncbi:uncharacterized protein ACHE_30883S [Aspergillus chevalieri]|uniref:Uncharacterized protein n=1 Tax=Aspergillus chevalieri TaxID=182096 RepID=A0A7R7VLH6_ASPCH|nr:uncharacterized protein ACHE_30883S [Aspergillus chevalieri]BCR86896.1 hypothetical protein ACHE_30883S [Aspergillus chevalieri]